MDHRTGARYQLFRVSTVVVVVVVAAGARAALRVVLRTMVFLLALE
jgi:hypothetical protein